MHGKARTSRGAQMSAGIAKRPGTVAHGERPGTTSKPTRMSLESLLDEQAAAASPGAGQPRKQSLTIEEALEAAAGVTQAEVKASASSLRQHGKPVNVRASRMIHTSSGALPTQPNFGGRRDLGATHSDRLSTASGFSHAGSTRRVKTAGSAMGASTKSSSMGR